ncbi:DNA polymerase III subunit theta [Citrobacter freundii]|uniref:DNA polymerase III subunit theta n=1 Tax=Citrobacter freundii TaxID=546 RepID=UPI0015EF9604|nr:DNA polymerase III subunit theta [Citrobacter freundii]QMG40690.1 DNA polymerase III subunit theta [Citrobacter freundii]
MSDWNIAAKPQEERDKVNVDLAAREQPENLREYFMERVHYYREQSLTLPKASDSRYLDMAAQNEKK